MKVHLNHLTPVKIQLYEEKEIDGRKVFWRTGEPITLRPGENEVDEEFMKKWLDQNPHQSILEKL